MQYDVEELMMKENCDDYCNYCTVFFSVSLLKQDITVFTLVFFDAGEAVKLF